MLTAQILTKDNQNTILKTIESLIPIKPRIIIGDLGSKDETVDICKSFGIRVIHLGDMPRDDARNKLHKEYGSDKNIWLQPWEALIQGQSKLVEDWNSDHLNVQILHGMTVSYDVRAWKKDGLFVNPVYEKLLSNNAAYYPVVLYSRGSIDGAYAKKWIDWWKVAKPLASEPYYYQACLLLSEGKYEDFTKIADHYFFAERDPSISQTMLRYYYAMVQLMQYKAYRPALQNINLCLCTRPLMAEFWCLMADVYYHLLRKFDAAKEFYENAIILGSRRMKNDDWPMDISKYGSYPKKMIDSCEKLMNASIYSKLD